MTLAKRCVTLVVVFLGTATIEIVQGKQKWDIEYDASVAAAEGPACTSPLLLDAVSGITRRTCKSEPFLLAPGQVAVEKLLEIGNPFEYEVGMFDLMTAELDVVDGKGRPVPLSEVYVHHWEAPLALGGPTGSAGLRHHHMKSALPSNYAFKIDASRQFNTTITGTFINIVGVDDSQRLQCMECWCDGAANGTASTASSLSVEDAAVQREGGPHCCSEELCASSRRHEAPREYFISVTVTYRPASPATKRARLVAVEPSVYLSVPHNNTQALLHYNYTSPALDGSCPQQQPITVLSCAAHLHNGASDCLTVYDSITGVEICSSCPVYGDEVGVAGNEDGFLVATTVDYPNYILQPGHGVRVTASYNASNPHVATNAAAVLVIGDGDEVNCPGHAPDMTDIRALEGYATRQATVLRFFHCGSADCSRG